MVMYKSHKYTKIMPVSLLSTKLHIPSPRQNAVARPRLVQKLLASMEQPGSFVLLSGPAGFGKTTLLSEFVTEFQMPVAWVSLDRADNDPIQFWTYLTTALQLIHPGIGHSALAMLHSPQPFPEETIPTLLINDIAEIPDAVVIVLDDYHVIENPGIHAAIADPSGD